MGKIAAAIEEVEDELDQLKEYHEALQKSYNDVLQELDTAQEKLDIQERIIEQYNAMEDYIEEYHPGIVTAFEVANRMEK